MQKDHWCSWKGKLVPDDALIVGANNRGLRFGDGLFETMKVVNGKIVRAQYHKQRCLHGLKVLHFQPFPHQQWETWEKLALDVVQKNGHQAKARVRLSIFRADGGVNDPLHMHPEVLIQSWPLTPSIDTWNENGLVLGVEKEIRKGDDLLANLKSNNFLGYAMAALRAKEQHWNDAVLLNYHNKVADTTLANVWVYKNGTWLTTPLTDGPVAGTYRAWLLDKYRTTLCLMESSLTTEDLLTAEAMVLTNAIAGIRWVKCFGDHQFSPLPAIDLYRKVSALAE